MSDPPHHGPPEPTLSTLVPSAGADESSRPDEGFDPESPSLSSFLLPPTMEGDNSRPLAPNPNPAIFRLLSSLALNEAPTSFVESDDEGGSQAETDSPESIEIDMAPEADHDDDHSSTEGEFPSLTLHGCEQEGERENGDKVVELDTSETATSASIFPPFAPSPLSYLLPNGHRGGLAE